MTSLASNLNDRSAENGNEVTLGKVLRRSLDPIQLDPAETYTQITVRLHHRGVVLRGIQRGSEIGSSRQYRAREGQLILSRIDARNGAIGLVPADLDGAVVTNDFWLFDIDQSQIVPSYLDYYVGIPSFVARCRGASEGTTNRVRLQPEQFMNLSIPLPPLAEQRRTVARIEALATKINEARGLRRAAEAEANALLDAELDAVFAVASDTFPDVGIGDNGGFVTSGPRGWGDYYDDCGDRRLIRVENVTNRQLELSSCAKVALPPTAGDIERSQVQVGDVLVTITGAIGRVGVVVHSICPATSVSMSP